MGTSDYLECPRCQGEGINPDWDSSENCCCPSYPHYEYIGAPLEVEVIHVDDCPMKCWLCGGSGETHPEEAADWIETHQDEGLKQAG